jgi:hypothetical protein
VSISLILFDSVIDDRGSPAGKLAKNRPGSIRRSVVYRHQFEAIPSSLEYAEKTMDRVGDYVLLVITWNDE